MSRDLRDWRVLPDALGPGAPGAFDDLATWTGSIVEHGGRWMLLYTGVSRAEGADVQRIGLASSADLLRWERHGMVLEADPRWYEPPAWRDPWVEARGDGFEMLLTARARSGPDDGRGVIGRARSADLRSWEALPPVSEPGAFLHLEVPQRIHLGGAWRDAVLRRRRRTTRRRGSPGPGARPQWGTHYLTAAERDGPYRLDREEFLAGDPEDPLYAGRVVEHRGGWWFMGWHVRDRAGAFRGELGRPDRRSSRDRGRAASVGILK